jgi:predicted transcriptional regulator
MVIVDDRILEYILENEHGSPSEMKKKGPIRYSRGYISERCQELANKGLLKPVGNGVYTITDRGEAYLEGDLDTHVDTQDEVNTSEQSPGSINEHSEDTA